MRYLHSMIRVRELEPTLHLFCEVLGFIETRRSDSEQGRYTLVYLAAPDDEAGARQEQAPLLELTYNWDTEDYGNGRNFGHLAYEVDNIYATCQRLMDHDISVNRPPRDGYMAFFLTPDGISVELLQKGDALPTQEPWASMPNMGSW